MAPSLPLPIGRASSQVWAGDEYQSLYRAVVSTRLHPATAKMIKPVNAEYVFVILAPILKPNMESDYRCQGLRYGRAVIRLAMASPVINSLL